MPVDRASGAGKVVSTPNSKPNGYIERAQAPKPEIASRIHISLDFPVKIATNNPHAHMAANDIQTFIVSSNKRVLSTKIPMKQDAIQPATIIKAPVKPAKVFE